MMELKYKMTPALAGVIFVRFSSVLTAAAGLAFVVFSVPYYSLFYRIAKEEKTAAFFAFREIPVNLARIIVFGLGILIAPNLKLLFPLAGAIYLFFFFWQKPKTGVLRLLFDRRPS